jgi:hypothetical protein
MVRSANRSRHGGKACGANLVVGSVREVREGSQRTRPYVTAPKLIVPATNEFGDPVVVKRLATGATVKRLDTHHYRPACLDYKL